MSESTAAQALAQVHARRPLPPGTYEVALVDAEQIKMLHQRYRGTAEATDVLAFDLRDSAGPGPGHDIVAQIVICTDVARQAATKRHLDPRAEVLLYLIHALLHLTGLNDDGRAERRAMHQIEDQILLGLGVGKVYQPGSRAKGRTVNGQRGGQLPEPP